MEQDVLIDLVTHWLETLRIECDLATCVGAPKKAILLRKERYSRLHDVVVAGGAVGLITMGLGQLKSL